VLGQQKELMSTLVMHTQLVNGSEKIIIQAVFQIQATGGNKKRF